MGLLDSSVKDTTAVSKHNAKGNARREKEKIERNEKERISTQLEKSHTSELVQSRSSSNCLLCLLFLCLDESTFRTFWK